MAIGTTRKCQKCGNRTKVGEAHVCPSESVCYTPGPWFVGDVDKSLDGKSESGTLAVWSETFQKGQKGNAGSVCLVAPPDFRTAVDEVNAKLIAAAPEMFELLKQISSMKSEDENGDDLCWVGESVMWKADEIVRRITPDITDINP